MIKYIQNDEPVNSTQNQSTFELYRIICSCNGDLCQNSLHQYASVESDWEGQIIKKGGQTESSKWATRDGH